MFVVAQFLSRFCLRVKADLFFLQNDSNPRFVKSHHGKIAKENLR